MRNRSERILNNMEIRDKEDESPADRVKKKMEIARWEAGNEGQ
jgi:hypothetical protein